MKGLNLEVGALLHHESRVKSQEKRPPTAFGGVGAPGRDISTDVQEVQEVNMATAEDRNPDVRSAETTGSAAKPWHPRMWDGMNLTGWFGLLVRNRFAVSPSRIPMAAIMTLLSVMNSGLWLVQMLILGRKIARTRIEHDPIFIIGHWRSGTTLLHEFFALDAEHAYPDTYACFSPNHFLISQYLIPWWAKYLMPARRPMDNMHVGWDRPQEDEFALCNMGIPSPYLMYAFPNRPYPFLEYLDLAEVSPEGLRRWKHALVWFLKCLTLRSPKRIVLKSPTHTCRIDVLLELFPGARFVHIVRDPYAVFPSTQRTWQRLSADEGLQVMKNHDFEKHVLSTFQRMYEVFEKSRGRIDPSRFCELRYEDLVADPVGQMRSIYEKLGLEGFDALLPALEKHVAGMAGYQTNRHQLSPEVRQQITSRWASFIDKYGYRQETSEV